MSAGPSLASGLAALAGPAGGTGAEALLAGTTLGLRSLQVRPGLAVVLSPTLSGEAGALRHRELLAPTHRQVRSTLLLRSHQKPRGMRGRPFLTPRSGRVAGALIDPERGAGFGFIFGLPEAAPLPLYSAALFAVLRGPRFMNRIYLPLRWGLSGSFFGRALLLNGMSDLFVPNGPLSCLGETSLLLWSFVEHLVPLLPRPSTSELGEQSPWNQHFVGR